MSVQFAGNEYTEDQFREAYDVLRTNNRRVSRDEFINQLGKQYTGDRDIYDVLGYNEELTAAEYRAKFERQDIARRIVELPARDTWKKPPDVTDAPDEQDDTEFEQAVDDLADSVRLWKEFSRGDIATGIGEYGLLFLGFADGQPLDEPVGSVGGTADLEFVTTYSQDQVEEWQLGRDAGLEPTDEMYNRPIQYTIEFTEEDEDTFDEGEQLKRIHHERIIHITEGRIGSEIKGTPRLRPVYNRLDDLQKVVGASAEMFWSGADEKYHFNVDAQDGRSVDPSALDNLGDEIQKLVHDMEKSVKTVNTEMEVVGGQEVNPTGVVDTILKFISGSTGIPIRILTGSERGELASSQDTANWYGTVSSRQNRFAEPEIVRPFIDRMIETGVLPSVDNYEVKWKDLFELNELEEAQIQEHRANAISTLVQARVFASKQELFDWMEDGKVPEFDDGEEMEPIPESVQQAQFQRGQQQQDGGGEGVSTVGQQDGQQATGDAATANVVTGTQDPSAVPGGLSRNDIITADDLADYGFMPEAINQQTGSRVSTPEGDGVVVEVVQSLGEDEDLEGTDLDPNEQSVYIVALVDGSHDFFTADDIETTDFDVDQPDDDANEAIQSANDTGRIRSILQSINPLASNDWSMPKSWRESSTPSRLILLDAWASMGGQFDCNGGCCMSELHSERLCAAMKDEVLGTTRWRGGWV